MTCELKGAEVGCFVSYWFGAFVMTLILAFVSALGLIGCWTIVPESSEGEITLSGRRLIRARSLFAIACGVIFACLFALIPFLNVADRSQPFRWFDEHQSSVPLLPMAIVAASGFSVAAFASATTAKGEGRLMLQAVPVVIAVLSFLVAIALIGWC